MRLKISKSKNVTIYYVIKTVYVNGKEKTVTVERLGNEDEILKKVYKNSKREYKVIDGVNTRVKEFDEESER